MTDRHLGTTLKNLVLAMLNATLILLVLLVWLIGKVTSDLRAVSEDVTGMIQQVQPLRDNGALLLTQLQGLRTDLATLADRPGLLLPEQSDDLSAKASELSGRLDTILAWTAQLPADPRLLLDAAATGAVAELARQAQDWRACEAPATAP